MSDNRWQQIQDLFEDALSRPVDGRTAFLDSACADDPVMRAEVEALLRHDQEAPSGFLEPPKPTQACAIMEPDSFIGARIGQYEIRRVIGSGGMATVYEAEQQKPKRMVALKLLRADLPSGSWLRRFDYEAEVLARLQHSNIAQIYQAGTYRDTFGRTLPYFAMEFVKGAQPITTHVQQKGLDTLERLKLFAQVCDAVHHGHQKGVIHRDLKPANILVDASGHVKVIDFGVARATDADLVATTLRTHAGALIGTLEYMSPEQCGTDPLDLDVRTDVYSLGVILYELLAGHMPYQLARRPIPAAIRVICESEPPRPSTLDRTLRGDLEIIILTALRKDRSRRYQSASALGDDIQRYIRREPISARPQSHWTRAVRWIARHPRLTTTAACLVIAGAIVIATVSTTSVLARHPSTVTVDANRSMATLFSGKGDGIHDWSSDPSGIRTAMLVNRPSEFGAGKMAVVAYTTNDPGSFRGKLCLFDLHGDLNKPVWHVGIENADLPPRLIISKPYMEARDFGVRTLIQADVFPEVGGAELVVAYQHSDYTHTSLRIYNPFSKGEYGQLLYEVWVDADIASLHWMTDARLLVIVGINGAYYWEERGYGPFKNQHPRVVFALRPKRGFLSKDYLYEQSGTGSLFPVWYRCIGPPTVGDLDFKVALSRSYGSTPPGKSVALIFELPSERGDAGLTFVIDDKGNEVPKSRRSTDQYKRSRTSLPDENYFQLQDLPPPKPIASEPEVKPEGPFPTP